MGSGRSGWEWKARLRGLCEKGEFCLGTSRAALPKSRNITSTGEIGQRHKLVYNLEKDARDRELVNEFRVD